MNRKVRITFPDVGKVNSYTRTKISEHAWQKQFDKWMRYDETISVVTYFENDPHASGFSRATRIGELKAVSLDFPTLILEGTLYVDDPSILSSGFDFHLADELKCEDFDIDAFTANYKVVSMEINLIAPSPNPIYESILEYLSDDSDATAGNTNSNDSSFRCIECREPFEEFEHIVKYRGNYYHESCFLELAIDILQAKPLHLDSSGMVVEQEDEPCDYEEDRYY